MALVGAATGRVEMKNACILTGVGTYPLKGTL